MMERARVLRKKMTDAENRLWYFLRNRRLNGYKFTRQFIIGHYIADFVCRDKKLIVEIDGNHHMITIEYDKIRTNYLSGRGYKVVRFWNNEVVHRAEHVLEVILHSLENKRAQNTLIRYYALRSPEEKRDQL